jgi:TRAP-type C4-dicarboxylate transport system substrate-binding protein
MCLVACAAASLSAAPIVLKIASPAPENSPIGQSLIKMAAEWKRVSNGEVTLKIYPGGSLGDSESFWQKIKTGLIDGAIFTSQGMSLVVPEFMSLSAPSLFESQEEFDYALDKLRPSLERLLSDKGYTSIALSPCGWIRIFSRYPIATPDDMRKYKLAVDPNDSSLIQLFKVLGMNVVSNPGAIRLQSMQTKAIDLFYTSPVYFSYQWSSYSKLISSMSDVRIAPFMGCMAMKTASWDKVPEKYRAKIMEVSAAVSKEMTSEMILKENSVIKELSGYGLKVVVPSQDELKQWQSTFTAALDSDKAGLFPRDMLLQARKAVAEFRAR